MRSRQPSEKPVVAAIALLLLGLAVMSQWLGFELWFLPAIVIMLFFVVLAISSSWLDGRKQRDAPPGRRGGPY